MSNLDEILISLKDLRKVSLPEYWSEVNKIAVKEQEAFRIEEKKLILSDDLFHRRFTI